MRPPACLSSSSSSLSRLLSFFVCVCVCKFFFSLLYKCFRTFFMSDFLLWTDEDSSFCPVWFSSYVPSWRGYGMLPWRLNVSHFTFQPSAFWSISRRRCESKVSERKPRLICAIKRPEKLCQKMSYSSNWPLWKWRPECSLLNHRDEMARRKQGKQITLLHSAQTESYWSWNQIEMR